MKSPVKYLGPYVYTSGKCIGRRYMKVFYDDGSKGTTLYSRYLMEQQTGRRLEKSETVDHVNEDKTDDRVENFQILSQLDNAIKSARLRRQISWHEFTCPQCGEPAKKRLRDVKHNRYKGCAGPFCGRKCARAWQIENRSPTRVSAPVG